jgi:hypothetical protein
MSRRVRNRQSEARRTSFREQLERGGAASEKYNQRTVNSMRAAKRLSSFRIDSPKTHSKWHRCLPFKNPLEIECVLPPVFDGTGGDDEANDEGKAGSYQGGAISCDASGPGQEGS